MALTGHYRAFDTWVSQNVSKKVLLKGSKFQTTTPSLSGNFVQRERQKDIHTLTTKGPNEIWHKMSMVLDSRKYDFGSQ